MTKQLSYKLNPLIKMVSLVAVSLGLFSIVLVGSIRADVDHTNLITTYEGSKTCTASDCHPGVEGEVLNSIHYKLMGEVQDVYNMFTNQPVKGIHGKGNRY